SATSPYRLASTHTLARQRLPAPGFRPRRFFEGACRGASDIAWLTPAGEEMTEADWRASYAKSVAVFLNGAAITEPDPRGDPITDMKFLLMFNAGDEPITFTLPEARLGSDWGLVVAAMSRRGTCEAEGFAPRTKVEVAGRAVVVLRSRT